MDFIIADSEGLEVALLKERQYIDIDIGNTNDFEMQLSFELYKSLGISDGYRLCVPNEEYGGIIDKIKTSTNGQTVTLSGPTWRGLLTKKIIEPPEGQAYRIVSGDANAIIDTVACDTYGGIFDVDGTSGILLQDYAFDRYVDVLAGLEKMLLTKDARLDIRYDSGEANGSGFVSLSAVPIHDYSEELEYSKDGTLAFLNFEMEKYTGGINHLICLGKGELTERLVVHLYVQEDGSIGQTPFYTGKDERAQVYDYSNAETADALLEAGIDRLKELMSYTNMDMSLYNSSLAGMRGDVTDVAIGDIVGGRDYDTGIYMSKQITEKIIHVSNGNESIEYKVGGNTLNRSSATAPVQPEENIVDKVYPVGSIYLSVNNVNPGTLFGGTWTAWGSGRVPVGVNASDTDLNAAEKTGGEKTHKLTATEMPSHTHTFSGSAVNTGNQSANHTHSFSGTTSSAGAHVHNYVLTPNDGGSLAGLWVPDTSVGNKKTSFQSGSKYMQSAGAHTHTISGNTGGQSANHTHSVTAKGTNTSTGGNGSHNNMQPYITCYMWKRTA